MQEVLAIISFEDSLVMESTTLLLSQWNSILLPDSTGPQIAQLKMILSKAKKATTPGLSQIQQEHLRGRMKKIC